MAAVNVPAEESDLARVDLSAIRRVLPGYPVSFMRIDGGDGAVEELGGSAGTRSAASSFPLAALAMTLWLGCLALARWMSRSEPRDARPAEAPKTVEER